MATVPVDNNSVALAAPRPVYQDPAAPSAAFGAAQADALAKTGPALQDVSDQLGQAAINIADQHAAVARVRDLGTFSNGAQQDLSATNTAQDMSNPATVQAYDQRQTAAAAQIVAQHAQQYGPKSAAALAATLGLQQTDFVSRANAMQTEAAKQMVATSLGSQINPIVADTYTNPANLQTNMARAFGAVSNMQPALGLNAATSSHNAVGQQLVQAAVEGTIRTGDLDSAQKILNTNGSLMDPETTLALNQHIATANYAMQRQVFEQQQKPIPFIAANAAGVAAGTASPATKSMFQMFVSQLMKPISAPNPTTGIMETRPGLTVSELPPGVAQAARLSGMVLPGQDNPSNIPAAPTYKALFPGDPGPAGTPANAVPAATAAPPQGQAVPQASVASPAPVPPTAAALANAGPTTVGSTAVGPASAPGVGKMLPQGTTADGPTLWQLNKSDAFDGIGPAAARAASHVPDVGNLLQDGSKPAAQTAVEGFQNRLQSALAMTNIAGNDRPTTTVAAKAASDLVDKLDPTLAGTKDGWNTQAVALDNQLAILQRDMQARASTSVPGPLDTQQRQQATSAAQQLASLREQLGAPPRLTKAQAAAAPKGFEYRAAPEAQ